MKVVITGGGTGGHFYPLIAVVESLLELSADKGFREVKVFYFSNNPYKQKELDELGIEFRYVNAGKMRLYPSLENFLDLFKVFVGIFQALVKLFKIFPDVVFAKGGYASFPTVVAAYILRIPIIIHESDSVPGRANKLAGKLAYRIAVSYPEAIQYFPKEKTAFTGQPIRKEVEKPIKDAGYDYMGLDRSLPVISIFGGSQGAAFINEAVLSVLPELLKDFQVVHQTGESHLEYVKENAKLVLHDSEFPERYHPYPFFDALAYKMIGGVSQLVITRAGSSLFEFAAWGVPTIAVPITISNGDHQRKNAYALAMSGAGQVIEESNMTPNILLNEIRRILQNSQIYESMVLSTQQFYKPGASKVIAEEIIKISLSHI